ncbi:rubis-subs-bind domain-containing protein [Haematococcus lacustris]|uniref:Rubis-subs-bind domain-containing protein n=1 Tax=Haematococcus lacustris TaxID=44745 RepID=A0A699ZCL2_HAELA|nr:rubis-subs-bind domain-containing protein [Haematococcus lacustris]
MATKDEASMHCVMHSICSFASLQCPRRVTQHCLAAALLLLLNYGLVDENNPYDKLQVSVILASTDPLYQLKRCAAPQSWSLICARADWSAIGTGNCFTQ